MKSGWRDSRSRRSREVRNLDRRASPTVDTTSPACSYSWSRPPSRVASTHRTDRLRWRPARSDFFGSEVMGKIWIRVLAGQTWHGPPHDQALRQGLGPPGRDSINDPVSSGSGEGTTGTRVVTDGQGGGEPPPRPRSGRAANERSLDALASAHDNREASPPSRTSAGGAPAAVADRHASTRSSPRISRSSAPY